MGICERGEQVVSCHAALTRREANIGEPCWTKMVIELRRRAALVVGQIEQGYANQDFGNGPRFMTKLQMLDDLKIC